MPYRQRRSANHVGDRAADQPAAVHGAGGADFYAGHHRAIIYAIQASGSQCRRHVDCRPARPGSSVGRTLPAAAGHQDAVPEPVPKDVTCGWIVMSACRSWPMDGIVPALIAGGSIGWCSSSRRELRFLPSVPLMLMIAMWSDRV